jgi:hypothetical protein
MYWHQETYVVVLRGAKHSVFKTLYVTLYEKLSLLLTNFMKVCSFYRFKEGATEWLPLNVSPQKNAQNDPPSQ